MAQASQQQQQQQTVAQLSTDVADLKQNATSAAVSLQDTQKNMMAAVESPVALHFKGITITPGGFMAAETVTRTHALGADINTPFNSIPYGGATASRSDGNFRIRPPVARLHARGRQAGQRETRAVILKPTSCRPASHRITTRATATPSVNGKSGRRLL